jgi:nucleoid-associated protein EbfC
MGNRRGEGIPSGKSQRTSLNKTTTNNLLEVSIMAKGFKAPKMSGQTGMMQQLQKLQEQIQATQAQLAEETVSATTGGGAVKVTVTGDQRCQAVEIDPEILQDADVDMLQDLILTAFNTALEKSRDMAAERLGPLSSGLPF